ncbi:MAG: hypothetical protein QOI57_2736 [Rubrobacteraceae bacterium]|nr:hypothetical protein [Rubrobacteraceae bacterium]
MLLLDCGTGQGGSVNVVALALFYSVANNNSAIEQAALILSSLLFDRLIARSSDLLIPF